MYYVYLLMSQQDQGFYIGYTTDIRRRFQEHQNGEALVTKHRRPLDLIYYEAYLDKRDAVGREKFLKSGSGYRYIKKQLKFFLEDKNYRGLVK
jgi:putative endonuclease